MTSSLGAHALDTRLYRAKHWTERLRFCIRHLIDIEIVCLIDRPAASTEMMQADMITPIRHRVVVHFPGFEPMNAQSHYRRFKRSADAAMKVWHHAATVSPFSPDGNRPDFEIAGETAGFETRTSIYLCDHDVLVEKLRERPVMQRILAGFQSAFWVVFYGGAFGYFRHAWRFGLFFVFPFLLMGAVLGASFAIAAFPLWLDLPPWHYAWSVPLALIAFRVAFLPFTERFLTLHLFDDWGLALSAARLDDRDLSDWLERCRDRLASALDEPADEYLVSSHSMGSTFAAHVLGMVLEDNPSALDGKKVVFLTLGGAILQCALLRPAKTLRRRVGTIARSPAVSFIEVQCLTDIIHFYKCAVVSICGHPDAPPAGRVYIRLKALLDPERYRRVRRDFLRVHRQYVLNGDRRGSFDFTLLTTGPFPASLTEDFSKRNPESLERL